MVYGNIVAADRQYSHLHPDPPATDELEPVRLDPSGAAAAANHGVDGVFFGVIARLDNETVYLVGIYLLNVFLFVKLTYPSGHHSGLITGTVRSDSLRG